MVSMLPLCLCSNFLIYFYRAHSLSVCGGLGNYCPSRMPKIESVRSLIRLFWQWVPQLGDTQAKSTNRPYKTGAWGADSSNFVWYRRVFVLYHKCFATTEVSAYMLPQEACTLQSYICSCFVSHSLLSCHTAGSRITYEAFSKDWPVGQVQHYPKSGWVGKTPRGGLWWGGCKGRVPPML